jgi:hypothetical protein
MRTLYSSGVFPELSVRLSTWRRFATFAVSPTSLCERVTDGARTRDLRSHNPMPLVLARPAASGYLAYVGSSWSFRGMHRFVVYQSVLARLQYSCSISRIERPSIEGLPSPQLAQQKIHCQAGQNSDDDDRYLGPNQDQDVARCTTSSAATGSSPRRDDVHQASLDLRCALICWRPTPT